MAPVAVNVVPVPPVHMATPEPALTTGVVFTVTVTLALLLQPLVVPVTVYVVVVDGFAVTLAPVVAESPVEGDQL